MSEAATSAVHTGKETIGEFLHVAAKYFAPFVGIIAGYFSAPWIGGSWSVQQAISGASNSNGNPSVLSQTTAGRLGGIVIAIIWLLVGGAFWSMRSRGGVWGELIGGAIGGFGFGVALGQVPVIFGGTTSNGVLDKWSTSVKAMAQGD